MPKKKKIELTPVEKYSSRCPACALAKGFVFRDGNAITLDKPIGRGDDSDYYAVLYNGNCKACKTEVFQIEIVIPSNPDSGTEFIDDIVYSDEGYEIYRAEFNDLEWSLYHYRNVVYARDDDITHEWLDRHFIGPFKPHPFDPVSRTVYPDPSPGLSEWDIAKLILKKIGPKALALKWP